MLKTKNYVGETEQVNETEQMIYVIKDQEGYLASNVIYFTKEPSTYTRTKECTHWKNTLEDAEKELTRLQKNMKKAKGNYIFAIHHVPKSIIYTTYADYGFELIEISDSLLPV